MTKKEIAEIKKLYQKDTGVITRVCGCYVGDEKDKIATFGEAFYSLQEEDSFKYYDIFKKTLSGTVGKNLLDLEFPLMSESPGGTQEFLFRLKNSELKDEELLLEFYDKIIENFSYVGNYLILLIHNAYDVPGIAKDGRSMEDASEEVYSFLLCSVCPVNLSKPGLSYHSERNLFQNASREWLADPPAIGFLFPAFEDRSTDLHRVLYYTKNADELQAEFVSNVLGAVTPMPLSGQRESFYSLVEEALGEKRDYQTLIGIQETIQEKIEESADEPQP
ncbi:hypothetical protein FACS1894111_13120 [Clostridia bacterium]|nr:hypothetical protein FACS1894111_13120 [Clostridia bacterium]